MASDTEPRKYFEAPRSLQKSYFGKQNLFALQFQYIVTLANCNKASIKKSSCSSSQFQGRGAFPGPLVPFQNMFHGGHQIFQVGKDPSGLPII